MGLAEYHQRQTEQLQQTALKNDAIIASYRNGPYQPQGGGGQGLLGFLGGGVFLVLALVVAYNLGLLSQFGPRTTAPPVVSAPGGLPLSIRSGHDYTIVAGRLQEVPKAGSGVVPEFTVTTAGLKLWRGTSALVLPPGTTGSMQTCLGGGRGAGFVRVQPQQTVPWSKLTKGRQFCLLPARSTVSLLTVAAARTTRSTFTTITWQCARPRPGAGTC
jgi:hypothetical protein